jgi:SPP1 family predicted phage head-tail adaptor
MAFSRGDLRHYVRVERLTAVLDTAGNVIQDPTTGQIETEWTLLRSIWAQIRPLSAREYLAAQQIQSQVSSVIKIEFASDIDATMRIVDEFGVIYNIAGLIPDPDSNREWLNLPCTANVNAG